MKNRNTANYADIFAALSSEPRLEVMRLLFAAHPEGMTVGDIQAQLRIPNSTLSHHLDKLRIKGLVRSRRNKQYLWYSVNAETLEDLLSFLYNGCSVGDRAWHADAAEQVLETVQNTSAEAGFMFEGFLRSVESLFHRIFNRIALPRGFERFTRKAIQAIFLAQNETRRLGHEYVGTEQLLLGLINEGSGIAAQALTSSGVNFDTTKTRIEQYIGHGKGTPADIPFTPRAKRALELALERARQLGHNYIGTEHLLLGILREREGMAVRVLEDQGVNLQTLEQKVLHWELPGTAI